MWLRNYLAIKRRPNLKNNLKENNSTNDVSIIANSMPFNPHLQKSKLCCFPLSILTFFYFTENNN